MRDAVSIFVLPDQDARELSITTRQGAVAVAVVLSQRGEAVSVQGAEEPQPVFLLATVRCKLMRCGQRSQGEVSSCRLIMR